MNISITYNVSSICNGGQYYFPGLFNVIKSDEQKNENVAIKHPEHKYVFTFVIMHKHTKVFITEILEDTPLHK